MKRLLIFALSSVTLPAVPHGGQYRGPGEVVPPSTGGSPGAPSSSGPVSGAGSSSGSTGPATPVPTPGATAPGGGSIGAAGARPRGIAVGEDLSKWQYWWEFNKDSYLLLRTSVRASLVVAGSDEEFLGVQRHRNGHLSAPPSLADIDTRIVPALRSALNTTNRDIVSSCLVALAKIGREGKAFRLVPTFVPYLRSHDQEIRETAALAMGITRQAGAAPILIDLMTDSEAGRKLTDRPRVDARTRAFAGYGLGLVAHAQAKVPLRLSVLRAAQSVLRDVDLVDRNVKIAAIHALSLFHVPTGGSSALGKLKLDAARVLLDFYENDTGRGRDVLRAHVPPAIARLVGTTDSEFARAFRLRLLSDLEARSRTSGLILRSVTLALGPLALSAEARPEDKVISQALRTYFDQGKDGQARYFALISLAQIGGVANRSFLLKVLHKGSRGLERPWAALALGCLAHKSLARNGIVDRVVGHAIHTAFNESRTPYARGALAIALGLCDYDDAAEDLLRHLESHGHQDEMSGYICVGLSLMQHEKALQPIAAVLDSSVRRPHRMRMAAIALGKLGDRRVTRRLLSMFTEGEVSLAKMAAVASALSQIGDRESIAPLRTMLLDKDLPNISRAFAAVALGGIADQQPLPWNAKIAENMNYRAAVETLVQSGAGVLEIL